MRQYLAPNPTNDPLTRAIFRDIDIINDSVLYVVAGSIGDSFGEVPYGQLYKSTNKGESWMAMPVDESLGYMKAQFLDEQVGYLIAELLEPHVENNDSHVLLKTTDGGATWKEVYRAVSNTGDQLPRFEGHYIFDIHFSSASTGIILVDDRPEQNDYATIRRTTDGGATWTTVLKGDESFRYPSFISRYGSFSFPTENVGFAMASTGRLFKTTDGGIRWDSVANLELGNTQIQFTSELVGYRIGNTIMNETERPFKTTDGGITWKQFYVPVHDAIELHSSEPIYITKLHFTNDTVGYLNGRHSNFGAGPHAGKNFFLSTRDGGATWRAATFGGLTNFDNARVYAMAFQKENVGWAAAYERTGAIWHLPCIREGIEITTSGPTTFTQGDSVALSLPEIPDAHSYEWWTGETTVVGRTIIARSSGRYEGRVRTDDGCIGMAAVVVVANPPVQQISEIEACSQCGTIGMIPGAEKIYAGCNAELTAYDTALTELATMSYTHNEGEAPNVGSTFADAQGNVYLTAWVRAGAGQTVLVRFAPNGEQTVMRATDHPAVQMPPRAAIAPDGNIIFAYTKWIQADQSFSFHLDKLTSAGDPLWTQTYGSASGSGNITQSIGFDRAGNIYTTSRIVTNDKGVDIQLQKFSPEGERLWSTLYNREGRWNDFPEALVVNPNGETFVLGYSESHPPGSNARMLVGFNAAGEQMWAREYTRTEGVAKLESDGYGGVYLTHGFAKSVASRWDPPLQRIDRSGNVVWERLFGADSTDPSGLGGMLYVGAMTVDSGGSVYVAGSTKDGYRMMRFDHDGRLRWSISDSTGSRRGVPSGLIVAPAGDIYLMYQDLGFDGGMPCHIVRFTQSTPLLPLSVPAGEHARAGALGALDLYPNPSSDEATVAYTINRPGRVTVELFDAIGNIVATPGDRMQEPGEYQMTISTRALNLPAGVYMVKLKIGEEMRTRMMIVTR